MAVLEVVTEIAASIERVWAWHQEVRTALPALTPGEHEVVIESTSEGDPRVGYEVVVTAKALGKRRRWVAKYVEWVPPHPVAFGVEGRFVDEQVSGPFSAWRHAHEFEAIDSRNTRLVDRVEYRVPGWPLTAPVDLLLVRPRLVRMFRHRQDVLKRVFPPGI